MKGEKGMNKDEAKAIMKFLTEMDKRIIEDNVRWNSTQKTILKEFLDLCYEEFKKENNIK